MLFAFCCSCKLVRYSIACPALIIAFPYWSYPWTASGNIFARVSVEEASCSCSSSVKSNLLLNSVYTSKAPLKSVSFWANSSCSKRISSNFSSTASTEGKAFLYAKPKPATAAAAAHPQGPKALSVFPKPTKVPAALLRSSSNPKVSAPIAIIEPKATFDKIPEKPPTDSLNAPKPFPSFSIPVKFLSEEIPFKVFIKVSGFSIGGISGSCSNIFWSFFLSLFSFLICLSISSDSLFPAPKSPAYRSLCSGLLSTSKYSRWISICVLWYSLPNFL